VNKYAECRHKLIFSCHRVTYFLEVGDRSELIAGLDFFVGMLAYFSEATERISVNFDASGPH
jgi:hypothetical protein